MDKGNQNTEYTVANAITDVLNAYRGTKLDKEPTYATSKFASETKENSLVEKSLKRSEDPLAKFLSKFASSLETVREQKKIIEADKNLKRKQIEEAAKVFAEKIKEHLPKNVTENETILQQIQKLDPIEKNQQEQTLQSDSEEQLLEELEENEPEKAELKNAYVKELKAAEKNSKVPEKLKKITDIKSFISSQVTEQFNKFKQQFPNLGSANGGGGTNAVQYALGGTMDGDLNVTGKFLSGGLDLADLFLNTGSSGSGPTNKLVAGSTELKLNIDGTIDFPSRTLQGPEQTLLTLQATDSTFDSYSKIVLSPYGFFAYDQNSNSISFDSTENEIVFTILDQHELKFDTNGILSTNKENGIVSVSGINSYGEILSGGQNILELMPAPIPGQSAYEIWISQGNTGSEEDFLKSLKGEQGIPGFDGLNGVDGINGEIGEQGPSGSSAYEIWLSLGNSGSETQFLNSFKGDQGLKGEDGDSAYQVWLTEGNTGTEAVFLSSLKGDKGDKGDVGNTGDSAYNIWISQENVGTESDFVNSLKGEKGDTGDTGDTVTNTDYLNEGSVNLFYRSDRVLVDSPVKSVAARTGDIVLGISDITDLQTTLDSKQPTGNYLELVNNLIPTIYLPGTVDEIQEYTNFNTLTSTGTELQSVLYITLDNNKVYRWSGSTYVEIVGSPGTTDNLVEGSVNKYFTIQRASSAAPVQSVANKTGDVLLEIEDIQNLQPSLTSTNTTTSPITAKLSSNLGAYSNNTVIPANTPFEIILKNLLTTVIPAVYTQPTLSVSVSPTTLSYEIGTRISPTLTPNFNKGSAGDATQFRIKSGASILSSTSTPFLTSFQINTTTTFTTEVNYLSGLQLYDNIGNPSGTPVLSGTKTATTTFTTFRNNYYTADTTSTAASDSTQVRSFENSTTSRSFNINIQAGDKRVSFAFPTSLSNINVQVVQTGVGNITTAFTNTTVSVAGANNSNSTNYRVYTYLVPAGYPQAETYSVSF